MLGDNAMQRTLENAVEGKVAKILNGRELAINRGSDDGVLQGMKFEVIDDLDEILDPDTKDSLGTFKRVKIRVKAVEVYQRFSITRTYETYQVTEPSPFDIDTIPTVASIFSRTVTKVRTISSSKTDYRDYEEGRGHVQVGDKVAQIQED